MCSRASRFSEAGLTPIGAAAAARKIEMLPTAHTLHPTTHNLHPTPHTPHPTP
ncbi:MAG: hypothetical protein F6J93_23465 [Oscillatoria sp. SIO1A7]|nr:hypothetical protein [Oscillatoria sp. SIO1A7]